MEDAGALKSKLLGKLQKKVKIVINANKAQ
jgi:hypothetical protein